MAVVVTKEKKPGTTSTKPLPMDSQLQVTSSVTKRVKATREQREKKRKTFATREKMLQLVDTVNNMEEKAVEDKVKKQLEWFEKWSSKDDNRKESKAAIKKRTVAERKKELKQKKHAKK